MRVAITGGIGSGKSEVLRLLKEKGEKVVSCDEINASMLVDKSYIEKISEVFPTAVIGNAIDKKILSSIVFSNKHCLEKLNKIAHPIIRKIALDKSNSSGVTFVEVPLLFESNMQNDYDYVLVVSASVDMRIKRASIRDNKSEKEIKAVILNQVSSYKDKKIDYIIDNSGSLQDLQKEVDKFIVDVKQKLIKK